MKSWVINILLFLSVCAAIFLFTVKFDTPTDPDKVQAGLKGISKYLPAGSHVVFRCDVPGSDLYITYVNYYLAPVRLVPPSHAGNDTTLLLLPGTVTDSATIALISRSSVIWQNKDDRYQYILIHHS